MNNSLIFSKKLFTVIAFGLLIFKSYGQISDSPENTILEDLTISNMLLPPVIFQKYVNEQSTDGIKRKLEYSKSGYNLLEKDYNEETHGKELVLETEEVFDQQGRLITQISFENQMPIRKVTYFYQDDLILWVMTDASNTPPDTGFYYFKDHQLERTKLPTRELFFEYENNFIKEIRENTEQGEVIYTFEYSNIGDDRIEVRVFIDGQLDAIWGFYKEDGRVYSINIIKGIQKKKNTYYYADDNSLIAIISERENSIFSRFFSYNKNLKVVYHFSSERGVSLRKYQYNNKGLLLLETTLSEDGDFRYVTDVIRYEYEYW